MNQTFLLILQNHSSCNEMDSGLSSSHSDSPRISHSIGNSGSYVLPDDKNVLLIDEQ